MDCLVYNHSTLDSVTDADMKFLARVTRIMAILFQKNRGAHSINYECHSLCRAISLTIPELAYVDGSYAGYEHVVSEEVLKMKARWNKHSWLVTPDSAVIDPHPVGIITAAPLLAVGKGIDGFFGSGLYIPDRKIHEHINNRRTWRRSQLAFKLICQHKELLL